MTSLCRFAICGLAFAAAAGLLSAQGPGEVKDQAGFFKLETIGKANEAIEALSKKGIRLAIETYATVPKESIDKVKEMKTEDREKFYDEWARKRLKDLGDDTILILFTREPKHLETAVGPTALKKFTQKDRKSLTDAMLEKLRNKRIIQVDEVLLDAAATLRKHFDAPAKDNP
jgi:organic radical activating enzyme